MARQLTEQQRTIKNADQFRSAFVNLHMAAVPVVMVRTREPFRAIDSLRELAFSEDDMQFKSWSVVHGWATYDRANPERAPQVDGITDPLAALKMVNGIGQQDRPGQTDNSAWSNGIYVMMYPHLMNLNKNPSLIHLIKEYARIFAENRKRLVLVTTLSHELPPELEDDVVVLDFDPPSYAELAMAYDRTMEGLPEEKRLSLPDSDRNRILSTGAGMTMSEFENALARSLVENRNNLPAVGIEELQTVMAMCKTEVVKKTDVLELIPPEDMANIGGLDNLKDWLALRVASFTDEATEFGIAPPRGIMLVGPPGTGKSLVAKATANMLGLPLIRFDVSRIFQSLVGSSEARVRSTLKLVDAMAPCVLFLDEIDKVFGGTVSGLQGDSGVGQRVLGSILTWLQEGEAPVFVVATANRVEYLPPEMMRRGRMDEVFSVQTPSEEERMAILRIHVRKRGHDPDQIDDLELAVAGSNGYVGAELEAAVADALVDAFASDDKVLTGALIAHQLSMLKPLSQAFPEQFQDMARWAHNNARPANAGPPTLPIRQRTRTSEAGGDARAISLDG